MTTSSAPPIRDTDRCPAPPVPVATVWLGPGSQDPVSDPGTSWTPLARERERRLLTIPDPPESQRASDRADRRTLQALYRRGLVARHAESGTGNVSYSRTDSGAALAAAIGAEAQS